MCVVLLMLQVMEEVSTMLGSVDASNDAPLGADVDLTITRRTTTIGGGGLELLHNVSHVSEDCVLGANTEVPGEDSVLGPTWHDASDPLAIAYQQNEVPTA